MGGVVVADHVQLAPRVGPGDELEEVQELGVGVALVAAVGHQGPVIANLCPALVPREEDLPARGCHQMIKSPPLSYWLVDHQNVDEPTQEAHVAQLVHISDVTGPWVGHRAGGDLQGGEQRRRPVALVVVGLLLRDTRPERQDRCGPVQRLDLGLRAPRGAALPDGGGRTPSPVCRSRPVKLGAA